MIFPSPAPSVTMKRNLLMTLMCCVVACRAQNRLVAKYNIQGVQGEIGFEQTSTGAPVTISLALPTVPSGSYSLALHTYRVNYDMIDPCDVSVVGQRLGNPIPGINSGVGTQTVSNIDLSGSSSIEGRSFLMTNGSWTICGTIEADTDYVTAFANLPAFLGGQIIFRQRADNPSADTMIYTDLYPVSSTSNPSTGPFQWQINSGVVAMDISADTAVADRCGSTLGDMYNPKASTGAGCSSTAHTSCKVGDLSSKLGDVSAGMAFFNDLNLPLSGQHSIIGKSIVFLMNGNKVACANIIQYTAREASVYFSDDGVKGSMTFRQRSPLDVAHVNISVTNLQSRASGYHIHEWPVPWKMEQGQSTCSPAAVTGHFNPFGVDVNSSPAAGTGTPDQYEVGDLSGKYGTMAGETSLSGSFEDTNLQLFGKNSIVGRSIVIHFADGSRWVCANIESSEKMVVALAKFVYPAIGYIVLKQPMDQWYAETQVYVEMNTGTTATSSINHNWHIHVSRISGDMLNATGRCMSPGGHYNPYGIDLEGDYATACNPDRQFRCELGDLSGKHGKLRVRSTGGGTQKAFFTDMQLPLSGPQSVLSRSIVLHDANVGAGRLSCANVYEQVTRTAAVTAWTSAKGSTSVSGYVKFAQDSSDTVKCIATVDMQLTNLRDQAGGYHVHEYPTALGALDPCSPADVGGHLNPFNAAYPGPTARSGTDDVYEIGDLSGKFGMLSGASSAGIYTDNNLPMEGPHSIVGRSVVVHRGDSGATRWSCGNIEETTPGATRIKVRAVFTGDIVGNVTMTQMRYASGELGNTYIVVDVAYKDQPDKQTTGHNWHVHVNKVTDGNCNSTAGHYNPYMVDLENNYDECSLTNPLRCEMGDQSGKTGQYSIGGGKAFFTDVNLPLEGEYAAVKRSIVFHAHNGGSSRIACADLLPYDASATTKRRHGFLSVTGFSVTAMENTVARAINTEPYNVAVVEEDAVVLSCTTVTIYFLGPDAENLATTFGDLVKSNNDNTLKPYHFDKACVAGAGMLAPSLLLILVCLFLSRDQWLS